MACFASPLLGVLGVPYLLARAVGTPASLALLALQGSFRGARDTATPLRAALIGTALNLALDPLLIGLFAWGVAGAAIATSFSQYAGMVLLIRALSRRCRGPLFPPGTR